jgi:NAD-dependent dihydropyrimidine dehydrogenase PreA subunit
MTPDVFERLAAHLDTLPAGYPATDSGVHLRLLRRLFSAEDAELALHLTLIPEEARVVARRARRPIAEVERGLQSLESKRLIMVAARPGKPKQYGALQFLVGIWEAQVDRLTPELVHDFEEYLPQLIDVALWKKVPQMRTVPVNITISTRRDVLPYERIEDVVRGYDRFAVSNCICRQEMHVVGTGCTHPLETCLQFGGAADSVVREGRARPITLDETLAILTRAEETGLVLQPGNAKDAMFLCACCGCCCGVLRTAKRHPSPGRILSSPFVAVLTPETCHGCGTCEARCPMQAVTVPDGTAAIDGERCIGCGLCVTTCPTGSLALERKPAAEQPRVPRTIVGTYLKIAQARGRLGVGDIVGLQVRSKIDRLLAR